MNWPIGARDLQVSELPTLMINSSNDRALIPGSTQSLNDTLKDAINMHIQSANSIISVCYACVTRACSILIRFLFRAMIKFEVGKRISALS